MSNFLKAMKNRTMDSFLVVLQKLLSCSLYFRNLQNKGIRAKFWLTIPRPEGPDSEKCPYGSLGKFCQAQIFISCGWIFGGRLRPDKGTQVPENSLKQFSSPSPRFSFPVDFLAAGCCQIRGRKSLKTL